MEIEADDVNEVCIAGRWLPVELGTFELRQYRIRDRAELLVMGGGFAFEHPDGYRYAGPLTSVEALRYES